MTDDTTAILKVSTSGFARSGAPNSHDGGHHQVPVSPIAQAKSGGQYPERSMLLRFSMIFGIENPTAADAKTVKRITDDVTTKAGSFVIAAKRAAIPMPRTNRPAAA